MKGIACCWSCCQVRSGTDAHDLPSKWMIVRLEAEGESLAAIFCPQHSEVVATMLNAMIQPLICDCPECETVKEERRKMAH